MTKKNLEDVESLQDEVRMKQQRIRELKRADSEIRLQLAVDKMSGDKKDQKEILDACYDYIAQHRVLFRKGGFNQSGDWVE